MDYKQFAAVLNAADASYRPAEWHGLLCGLICAGRQMDGAAWFEAATQMAGKEAISAPKLVEALRAICSRAGEQLGGDVLELELMLPDDSDELQYRTEALREWCAAFLYGLGLGGLREDAELSDEAGGFLQDLAEFCQVYHDQNATTDADEFYFLELEEYIRAGVTLLYDELNAGPPAGRTELLH
jgi:uncharacterized protein YgfB (UPF0149 family)